MRAFLLSAIALVVISFSGHENPKVYPRDFLKVSGQKWKGILTYLDYSSGKQISIDANITVTLGSDSLTWYFVHEYPKEPQANSIDTVILMKDGRMINDETVIERTESGVTTLITTQKEVVDDGIKKYHHSYT